MDTNNTDLRRTSKAWQSAQFSNDFINRIEQQRLDSECLRPLDLRPYVTGPCKRYSYRGRSLWLNSEAHQLFLEGLSNNSGVFTVGTYESILRHFFIDLDKPVPISELDEQQENSIAKPHSASLIVASTVFKLDRASNDLAIDLSYFERRVYDRFKETLIIGLIRNGQTYTAETRDISQSGLQLRINATIELNVDDIVQIDVSPLVDRQLEQPELDYRVVRIRHLLHDTLLGLQCVEKEAKDGRMVISEYVALASESEFLGQADPEDALLTAKAQLAERFYMHSTSILPFFLFASRENQSPLRMIFGNRANQRLLDVFENAQGNYDFSSLVTPTRIKLLTRLALRDSKADTLIAVYRTNKQAAPKVIADLECKNHKHWCRLLNRYANQPGFRVFKLLARPARRPVEMRIEDALEPLNSNHDDFVRKLLKEAKNLTIVGALIDVTKQILTSLHGGNNLNQSALELPVIRHDEEKPHAPPQLIPIQYIQENRSEERYIGKMKVKITIAGLDYEGVTRDVSVHGLSVELKDPYVAFINHRQAKITFPTLEGYSSSRARHQGIYRNVPVEIVGASTNGEQILRFKICDDAKGHQFANAFSALLTRQKSGLCKENSHILNAATSRLYSSIFIESSSTLPAFIYRRADGDWTFRLGLSTSPTPLIDYFEVADGTFDFSVLTCQSHLQRMMKEVSKTGSSEIILYLNKVRRNNSPTFVIHSLADFEISDGTTRDEFIHRAMEHDFRCIKIIINQAKVPPSVEIDQAVARLAQLSNSKCERLKAEFDNLIAIGDVIDMTGLIAETCSEEQIVNLAG
jgi:hypothetical protein